MTRSKIIGLIAVVATTVTAISCWQAGRQETCFKIKVENDGNIISSISHPATTEAAYDPYFIHVNDTPHIQFSDAELSALASPRGDSFNHHIPLYP